MDDLAGTASSSSGGVRYYLRFLEGLLVVVFAASLPVSLTASWILFTAGVITSIVVFLLEKRAGNSAFQFKVLWGAPLTLPLLLFVAIVTVSGAYNSGGGADVLKQGWRSFWAMKGLFVYFWARWVCWRHPGLLFSALQLLLIVSGVGGVWGTIQQIFNFHPFGYQYLQGTGFHGGPMPFAGQMQLFSMLALALVACRGNGVFEAGLSICGKKLLPGLLHRTPLMLLVCLCNCLGLLFAGERSAWAGGVAGMLLLAALLGRKIFAVTVAALGVLAAAAWTFVPLVRVRIASLFNGQSDISVQARLILWEKARQLWHKSPVFGVGIENFPAQAMPEAVVPGRSFVLDHAHSNYFHLLATTGALGLASFALLFITALCSGIRNYLSAQTAHWRAVYLGVTAGTLALMVSGAFEYNFGTSHVRIAQWFLLAIIGLSAYEAGEVVEASSPEGRSAADTSGGDNSACNRFLTSAAD